jgi:hypothetical protein
MRGFFRTVCEGQSLSGGGSQELPGALCRDRVGAECDRWAAVLSAMVDGEAGAADLVDVRPHLPNCPACRATVRELFRASVPLAAVFPAAGLALTDGPVGQAGGLLGRLAEWVLTSAHERGGLARAPGPHGAGGAGRGPAGAGAGRDACRGGVGRCAARGRPRAVRGATAARCRCGRATRTDARPDPLDGQLPARGSSAVGPALWPGTDRSHWSSRRGGRHGQECGAGQGGGRRGQGEGSHEGSGGRAQGATSRRRRRATASSSKGRPRTRRGRRWPAESCDYGAAGALDRLGALAEVSRRARAARIAVSVIAIARSTRPRPSRRRTRRGRHQGAGGKAVVMRPRALAEA